MPKKKKESKLVGKIGWCDAKTLGLNSGHYVFIRKINHDMCEVNTLTSLKTSEGVYQLGKMKLIENGYIYPIPKNDDTLKKFGGIDKRVIKKIPISKIHNIGKHKIKSRHHDYIKKYMK